MRIPPRRKVKVESPLGRSVVGQLEKMARSSNRGFVETRRISFYKYRAFLLFVADRFGIGDICLIEPRHVAAFVKEELGRGIPRGTLLAKLSAIRFWHRQVVGRKYDIPPNKDLIGGDLVEEGQRRFKRPR